MPKELFFKIPEEKRRKVMEAGLAEFSAHRLFDASINRIVKAAGIPRGSFYQYFEDKEDLYFHLMEEILDTRVGTFAFQIAPEERDLFAVFRKLFLFNLALFSEKEYHDFFVNLYLSINHNIQQRFKATINRIRDDILEKNLRPENWKGRRELLIELTKIIEMINIDLLSRKITGQATDDEVLAAFDLRIELLRYGFLASGKEEKQ